MNIPGAAAAVASTVSSQAPSWDGVRAVHSQPPLVNWASMPCRPAISPISPIAAADWRQTSIASVEPSSF
jgi:hypothetical protein